MMDRQRLIGVPADDLAAVPSLRSLGTGAQQAMPGNATIGAASGGTGQTTYTTGDTLYASATNVLSKLAKGTAGQVLTMGASVPAWATTASTAVDALPDGIGGAGSPPTTLLSGSDAFTSGALGGSWTASRCASATIAPYAPPGTSKYDAAALASKGGGLVLCGAGADAACGILGRALTLASGESLTVRFDVAAQSGTFIRVGLGDSVDPVGNAGAGKVVGVYNGIIYHGGYTAGVYADIGGTTAPSRTFAVWMLNVAGTIYPMIWDGGGWSLFPSFAIGALTNVIIVFGNAGTATPCNVYFVRHTTAAAGYVAPW